MSFIATQTRSVTFEARGSSPEWSRIDLPRLRVELCKRAALLVLNPISFVPGKRAVLGHVVLWNTYVCTTYRRVSLQSWNRWLNVVLDSSADKKLPPANNLSDRAAKWRGISKSGLMKIFCLSVSECVSVSVHAHRSTHIFPRKRTRIT